MKEDKQSSKSEFVKVELMDGQSRIMVYLPRAVYEKALELAGKEGITFEAALARVKD